MTHVTLPPERRGHADALCDWLLGDARQIPDANDILTGLCERLNAAGFPVDRATSAIQVLNSETLGVARVWERGAGARETFLSYGPEAEQVLAATPFRVAHETGDWVNLWVPDTADDAFSIVPDLRADGIQHYICVPVTFINGMENAFSFATKNAAGFGDDDLALLRMIMPALGSLMEILALHRILNEVVRIYVGDEPRQRILSGDVHRGEVTHIESAILFADMRGFTALSMDLEAEQVTDLLNRYYDCVVPHVEEAGGEVLKFIGDGILAVFRAGPGEEDPCARSLRAAHSSLRSVDEAAQQTDEAPAFDVGIALHLGEAAYGNVGSGQRLDFTVIGRDVNITSRIADLCGKLDERLLVSEVFAKALGETAFTDLGAFELKGVSQKHRVFAARSG